MRIPLSDFVLLFLLVLFFGLQQLRRPHWYLRFWFAGWVLVFLSFAVWQFPLPVRFSNAQELLRLDLLLLGGMAFIVSFHVTRAQLKQHVLLALTIWAPACVGVDLQMLNVGPYWLIALVIVAGEAAAMRAAMLVLAREGPWARGGILVLCVGNAAGLLAYARLGPEFQLFGLVAMQVFATSAILFAKMSRRRSTSGIIGTLGFLAWAMYYPLAGWPPARGLLYSTWEIPKYMVGFGMILHAFEISRLELERMADRYRALYEDFRLLYERHPQAMWIYDRETTRLVSANPAATGLYGYSDAEFLEMTVTEMLGPAAAPQEESGSTGTGVEADEAGQENRALHRRKDGSLVAVAITDRQILFQGREARFVHAVDVTEQDRTTQELLYRAHHDVLTGLPNRRLFEDRLQQCLVRCARDENRAVLLAIDVDHFKLINDTHGHGVGDECLREVAARLLGKVRQVDTMARTGGEEFSAIIGGLAQAGGAEKIAEELLRLFDEPVECTECVVSLTISIGAAIFPEDGTEPQELLERADAALYGAKRRGRNRAVFASPELMKRP